MNKKKLINEFNGESVLSADQFTTEHLEALFDLVMRVQLNHAISDKKQRKLCKGLTLTNLFYEPSTRTSSSFMAAMQNLGGSVIPINEVSYSSVVKGESLRDTVRTLALYSDVIALRHPTVGSAREASRVSRVPIVNAGDGIGEHPTQSLLDLYTIFRRLGRCEKLNVTFIGDLKNGRTVHSLIKLLSKFEGNTINCMSPEQLALSNDFNDSIAGHIWQTVYNRINNQALVDSDVVYVTRVQKERFSDVQEYEKIASKNEFGFNSSYLNFLKNDAIIMHPFPRVNEIAESVDSDHRAAYFDQIHNGLFVRMALLALVLGRADLIR